MNERTAKLRRTSMDTAVTLSPERARLMTEFYQANEGKYSAPVMRAMSFRHLCEHKTIYLGEDELIVGERGPAPKAVPTYPELTCHSLEDLHILDSRPRMKYAVSDDCFRIYKETIIPYWRGRSMRDKIFAAMSDQWLAAYDAGIFTEFMEQRAPGHTVLDGKIYAKGMLDFKREIAESIAAPDFLSDAQSFAKSEQLKAMDIACDAVILFAARHAKLAAETAAAEPDPVRKAELEKIADVCTSVPAGAPRDFHEALQYYWFCHLSVITELNGWDAFNPGHLDQHLLPFYRKGLADGTLTHDKARELLEAFFVKFNNHPAPPKVGVTAAESGTYNDFTNINIGGLLADGSDGSNEISCLLLDIVDDMHMLQPGSNLQLSRKIPEALLKHTLRVIRKGYGYPSIFNADAVIEEQLRQGKTPEDARAGGCSGCVETVAFGKEACILTGYFNMVKILELTLHNGVDPRTGRQLGPRTGGPDELVSFDALMDAFRRQVKFFLDLKLRGNHIIEQMYAAWMPAPFLSVIIDDCIGKGKDYNAGGARYNNSYIQFVGIGSLTDCLSAVKQVCFDGSGGCPDFRASGACPNFRADENGTVPFTVPKSRMSLSDLVRAMDADFQGQEHEILRQRLLNRTHKYGNDDDYADRIMVRSFEMLIEELDGRPNGKGGCYRVEMLPTTSHVYFGSVTGAMPDGRKAGAPLSEGISPTQGADRRGPTAVLKSAGKMDHVKTGGTLLNMKFSPSMLNDEEGIDKLAGLIRAYFKLGGHHVQFNVVRRETLRQAQAAPEQHRGLLVRVAGYSDYFCDLTRELQDEIITRTEHGVLEESEIASESAGSSCA
jgi:pyruvate-formate lyase